MTVQEYSAALKRAPRRVSITQDAMRFPMYVVRVSEFLKMREARPHHILKAAKTVEVYSGDTHGTCIFISHQWCSREHPDPAFQQLGVLQSLLLRLESGKVQVEVDLLSIVLLNVKASIKPRDLRPAAHGCLWYDYFSVPQPCGAQGDGHTDLAADMGKAVFSIPAYVELCHFFVVLAPPVPHQDSPGTLLDYHSWKQRGWCRLERAARALSPGETHILLVRQEDVVFQVGAQDHLWGPVGDGAFSVEGDRALLAPILVALLQNKLQALLQAGDLHGYRRTLSTRAAVLHGLPGVLPRGVAASGFDFEPPSAMASFRDTAQSFLHLYGLPAPTDKAGLPTQAILFAAAGGDEEVVRGLLELRASVAAREGAADPGFLITAGMTPLHLAGMFGYSASLVRLLLQQRADIEARAAKGLTPLVLSACAGCEEVVAALLTARASVHTKGVFAAEPLHVTASLPGRARVCAMLIQAGASAQPNEEGTGPLSNAAAFGAGLEAVELLARRQLDCDYQLSPRWLSTLGLLILTLSLPHRLWGSRCFYAVVFWHLQLATPLMIAALLGNVPEAIALIKAGADPAKRNARGKTAAELGALMGMDARSVAHLEGAAGARMGAGQPARALTKTDHINDFN